VDRPRYLNHQPAHADHAAVDLHAVEVDDLLGQGFHFIPWLAGLPAETRRAKAG
jgi:hypothetical protein